MGASITLAGEDLIALKQGAQEALNITRFVFAMVPGLDPSAPLDRAAPKPPASQIVHVHVIPDEHRGYVNPSQVVYSAQIGSDVGDWDFNWIGLESAEGVLFAVATVALQQKRRNIPPIQVGNNLTRNFLVVFDGAQALTGITIDASTWQHDFTVRLAGIDERERQSNRDIYGRACFFGSSLQLEKVGTTYRLKAGTAYIEGIRLQVPQVQTVAPPTFPTTAWLDVALQRELSDLVAAWKMAWGPGKTDYVDSAGVQHYLVPIAELTSSTVINDLRSTEAIDSTLLGFINTKEPAIAASGSAYYWRGNKTWADFAASVRSAMLAGLSTAVSSAVAATDSVLVAIGKLQAQVTGLANSKLDTTANAVSATKLRTARAINGVNFDGTANITVEDDTKLPLSGGTLTGQILTGSRQAGIYGIYDSTKVDHVWSMGQQYRIAADGSDFGTLYGLAYKHTNNSAGGNMAGGHQLVLCQNGTPGVALGLAGNIWIAGSYTGKGSGLTDIPQSAVQGLESDLLSKAAAARQIIAGNGLNGGGNLGSDRTIHLATPGTLSGSTGNNVTSGSHTHALAAATEALAGVIELATPAEVLSGTDNVRAVSPAALVAGLLGLGDMSPSGYVSMPFRLANGQRRNFIFQWTTTGAISNQHDPATITYPTTFPNACLGGFVSDTGTSRDTLKSWKVLSDTITNSSAQIMFAHDTGGGAGYGRLFAFGF